MVWDELQISGTANIDHKYYLNVIVMDAILTMALACIGALL